MPGVETALRETEEEICLRGACGFGLSAPDTRPARASTSHR